MDQFTFAERIFRGAVMAFPGAAVGLIAGLVWARRTWPAPEDTSLIVPLILVGAGVGVVSGFCLSDYAWKRVLRILLPLSKWP
jgi:hypothetical protein